MIVDVTTTWQTYAACQGLSAEIFYPSNDSETAEAKMVCRECPVQQSCLEYALMVREKDGIWGGATEKERRRIIRQRRRAAAKARELADV